MILSVRMYEAANAYGPLEQFDVDPATATVMDIMRRVRKSTALHNRHVRVGMRLHTYADHVPGDLINDTEKDPLVLSATLDELQQSGCVEYEEGRHGLHLKVLVDGCRTGEEAAEFTLEHSWRMEYAHAAQARELAALTREVQELKDERDVAVRLARAALGSDVYESKTKQNSADSNKKPPRSSFMQLVSDVTMSAADRGDLCGLRVLYKRLLREASDQNCVGHTCNEEAVTYLPVVDEEGMTVVHRAAQCGQIETVRMLLKKLGADLHQRDKDGRTPLQTASQNGHVNIIRELAQEFFTDGTLLHFASANGHTKTVRMLVEELGKDVNTRDKDRRTSLHLASAKGHIDTVRALVKEFRAQVNTTGYDRKTPLHLASENGHTDVVRALVEEIGAEVNTADKYGKTPLHLASENGHADTVRTLVMSCVADVSRMNNDGETPLHLASANGHIDAVRILIKELGARVNSTDECGRTPLHLASASGYTDMVRMLVKEFGADVNAKDEYGNTSLNLAFEKGHVETERMLIKIIRTNKKY